MSNFERIAKTIVIVLITIFLTIIVTTGYILNKLDIKLSDTASFIKYNLMSSGDFNNLKNVYGVIKERYYQDVDNKELERAAIDGMLYGLGDEYSYFMTQEEYDEFEEETSGNYTGVGLYLANNTKLNKIEIISPIKDTPAYNAGIRTGDFIVAVEGVEYTGQQMKDAVSKIKNGVAGTNVNITIQRDEERKDYLIERTEISLYKLEYEVTKENIGYINIKIFNEDTINDFENAYNDLVSKNVKGIIIDVRDNPGGYLAQVVGVCDKLVPKGGIIVYTVDKNENRKDYVSKYGREDSLQIVVLINNGSASASEILTSALQDHGIATVIGENSYGKGLVQTMIKAVGSGYIKLTTSEYFTPNGNKINKIGVKPDIEIKNEQDSEEDTQLLKAIEVLNK